MSEDNQLGSLLIARGLLTGEQLDAALEEQLRTHRSLGRVLIEQGLVSEAGLVSTLATQLGLEYVDLSDHPVDATATMLISDGLARRYQALPIGWDDGRLVVAMADPSNIFAVDDIRTITGADVRMVVATRESILAALDKYHRLDSDAESISAQAASSFEAEDERRVPQDGRISAQIGTRSVAQRLARRLCPKCRQGYTPSMTELVAAGWGEEDLTELPVVFRPVGCQACGKTGYQGRFALHEVLTVTEEIERLIVDRDHSEDIKKMATAQGMLTLRQAGLTQVRAGLTSIEEILRVVA